MKLLKKIAIMAAAVVLAMGLAVPAFADDGGTEAAHSITINNPNPGHTYEAYQIFTGDLHNGKLSNIKWGANVSEAGQQALGSADAKAASLTDGEAFSREIAPYLTGDPVVSNGQVDGKYVLNLPEAGYYLVKDKDGSLTTPGTAYTEYIVRVAGQIEVNAKSSAPQVTKKTKDSFDSEGFETRWQDSGDYDIGDTVPFKLEANLAENVADFATYTIVFHDTLSKGLEFKEIVSVTVNGEAVAAGYNEPETAVGENGETLLTITFPDMKRWGSPKEVVVEYTATLTQDAVIGEAGNPNTVYLEYSNNPYGAGTGTTLPDKVIIFTYQLEISKVDGDSKPLPGAGFTLYKIGPSGAETKVGDEIKGEELTTFIWRGLDDGNYKLVETTTPSGYNTIAPITFAIHAEHDLESADPKLTNLHTSNSFVADRAAGTLKGDIVNQAGAVLPSTGGTGTTFLYVIGAALILGAGIALVVRKRARDN